MTQGTAKMIRSIPVAGSVFVSSTIPETDYPAWSSVTTYAALDRVISTTTHMVYEALAGTNTNHDPTNSANIGVWWQEVGATNRWAMFDQSTGTQSSAANSFSVSLLPGVPPMSMAVLNIDASAVRLVGIDPIDGTIYDQTKYTAQDTLVGDWYSYFFDAVVPRTDLFFDELPAYANATWTLTFTNTGSTAACGVFQMGRALELGKVRTGLRFGIIDYSTKTADDFGGYTIVPRSFSKRSDLQIVCPNESVDAVATLLSEARATPTVFIGVQSFQSTFIYGFAKDWEVAITGVRYSELALSIEGLT